MNHYIFHHLHIPPPISPILLRGAVPDELPLLVEMYGQLCLDEQCDLDKDAALVETEMAEFLASPTYAIFLLARDEDVLGYVLVNTEGTPLCLRHLFIKRDYRRNGYGQTLVYQILDHYGMSTLDIEGYAWNEAIIAFYREMGFDLRCHLMRLTRP